MKKLIAIVAVLLLVSPAMAADWTFLGSQRLGTWYGTKYNGDYKVNGQKDDSSLHWNFQANSRLEAKVRADKVTGHVELALAGEGGASSGIGDDTNVTTRRAYGVWKFSENAWLKVGKDYSPVTEFISNQVFNDDTDLLGWGNFFGGRPSGLTLGIGDFELAFLTARYGGDVNTTATGVNGTTGGGPDSYIPKIEAGYRLSFASWFIKPFAGFQWYKVDSTGLGNVTGDLNVYSWVLGISGVWNIGPFSLGGQLSYGMNEGNAGWSPGPNPRAASSAYLKGGNDIANAYTLQAVIVPAWTFTDWLRFEAGWGYRVDNADGAPGPSKPDAIWAGYLQAMVTLAPGVYLCPEVGRLDGVEDRSGNQQGWSWYAAAKWQVDF
jgi:hypothetical protein